MASIPFSDARSNLTEIANRVVYEGTRIVISRNNQDLLALISIEDFHTLEALEYKIDLEIAKKVDRSVKRSGTVS